MAELKEIVAYRHLNRENETTSSRSSDGVLECLQTAVWAAPPPQRASIIQDFVKRKVAALLSVRECSIDSVVPISAIGLDSLKALDLKCAVDDVLGTETPVSKFLSEQSIESISSELALAREPTSWGPVPASSSVNHETLSYTQHAIWADLQRERNNICYNLQIAMHVSGALEPQLLQRSLTYLVDCHPILRTVYRSDGATVTQNVVEVAALGEYFSVIDASAWPEARVLEDLTRRACDRFDLTCHLPIDVALYRRGGASHVLLIRAHHIAVDLWSVLILLDQLIDTYAASRRGDALARAESATTYKDFAQWQNDAMTSGRLEAAWQYWRTQLSGPLPVLTFARPESDSAGNRRFKGSSCGCRLDGALARGLRDLSSRSGSTLFTVLLAAYKVLLYRYGQGEDIVVGTAGAGRSHGRFKSVIGNLVNPLAIRTRPSPNDTFLSYLDTVRATMLDALTHQDFPFSALVERLKPDRTAGAWPIFQTLFVYRTPQPNVKHDLAPLTLGDYVDPVKMGEWMVAPIVLTERGETFDLTLTVVEQGGGLYVSLQYRFDAFDRVTILRMTDNFLVLLGGIVADPAKRLSDLPVLGDYEKQQWRLNGLVKADTAPTEAKSIQQMFEGQAMRVPDVPAVACRQDDISYRELNRRANQLAHYLRSLGVGPDRLVGVCMERSLGMIIAILGTLKAGGAYVPLEPEYPDERLAFMLRDANPDVVLTNQRFAELLTHPQVICLDTQWALITQQGTENPESEITPQNLAYVIYTSGSTGQPKGVGISHESLARSIGARLSYYESPIERFLLLSSFAFDSSVAGIFGTLCQGGQLVLPEAGVPDPRDVVRLIARHRVSHLLAVPSLYDVILGALAQEEAASLRVIIVAGEPCRKAIVDSHLTRLPQAALFNEYGPTEAAVWTTVYRCESARAHSVPIGRPIAGAEVHVFDRQGNIVPIGVAGELCIGGAGLARGYLHAAGLTAERFVPNAPGVAGTRLYRTGDLVRSLEDGNLEYLGRTDHQINVRGYRVELGEVEARIAEHPRVKEAVVVAREESAGDCRLFGYVVPQPWNAATVNGFERYQLPNGMEVAHYSKNETDYLYRDIFQRRVYIRHGISLDAVSCVFDVGANIGMFTLFMREQCPDARIYAFEPIPALFQRVEANVALYGDERAQTFPLALASEVGSSQFTFYSKMSLMSGRYADSTLEHQVMQSYLSNQYDDPERDLGSQRIEELLESRFESECLSCPISTISEVIRQHNIERIDLLKIDVERSELDVLRGIAAADWSKIVQVVIEVEDRHNRLNTIIALLEARGYSVECEQDALLQGTSVVNVYARRVRAEPATLAPRPGPVKRVSNLQQRGVLRVSDLQDYLRDQLPQYMLPSSFVILDALPLTPNGKVDRNALPAADAKVRTGEEYAAPRNATEEILAGLWAEVLGVKRLGIHDNFFELGGHSLLGIQVLTRVQEVFNVELPLSALFDAPTISQLMDFMAEQDVELPDSRQLDQLLDELEQMSDMETQRLLAS